MKRIADILSARPDWPADIRPAQKSGTAALAIRVPSVDCTLPLAGQAER